jgi:aryl-alcohol dehydrogenase-like predicted oxidoreductase
MELRPLGGSGLAVTPLGLGTRGHRAGLRDTEPADAERAIYAAIDAGCGLIECGPRWGESERLVGAAVRDLRARDRVVVATRLPAAGPRPPAAAAIVAAVDASLRATRLEVLPLCWLDGWRDAWLDASPWPEVAGTMAAVVRAGKVLTWGLGIDDPAQAGRGVVEVDVAAVGVRWSLLDRAAAAVIAAAATAGRAVIARAPLAEGALIGHLDPAARYRADDERAAWAPGRVAALAPTLARLAALARTTPPGAAVTDAGRAILDGLRRHPEVVHATVGELAVAAALAAPVAAAVIGVRRAAQVATWWPRPPAPVPVAIAARLPDAVADATWPVGSGDAT